jgi:hypothetical protein
MRFDGLLDSFSCGLGRVHEHAYRASLLVHDFVLVMPLLVLLMLVPRESHHFVLMTTLALFVELISHGMFLRKTQIFHF